MSDKTRDWQGPSLKEFITLMIDNIFIYVGVVLAVIVVSFLFLSKEVPESYEGKIRFSTTPFVNTLNSGKSTNAKLRKTNAIQGVQCKPSLDTVKDTITLIELNRKGESDKDPAALLKAVKVTSAGSNNYDVTFKNEDAEYIKLFMPFLLDVIEDELNESVQTQLSNEIKELEYYLEYEKQNFTQLKDMLKELKNSSGYLIYSANQKSYEHAIQLLSVRIPADFTEFAKITPLEQYIENHKINDAESKELTLQYQKLLHNQLVAEIFINTQTGAQDYLRDSLHQSQNYTDYSYDQIITKYQNHLLMLGFDIENTDTILTDLYNYFLLQERDDFQRKLEEFEILKKVISGYDKQYTNEYDIIVEYERHIQYLGALLEANKIKIENVSVLGVVRDTTGEVPRITYLASIFFALGIGVVVVLLIDAFRTKICDVKTIKKLINTSIPPIFKLPSTKSDEECKIEVLEDISHNRESVFTKLGGIMLSHSPQGSPQNYGFISLDKGTNNECTLLNICFSLAANGRRVTLVDPIGNQTQYENIVSRYGSYLSEQGREIGINTFKQTPSTEGDDVKITILLDAMNDAKLLDSQRFSEAIQYVKNPTVDTGYLLVNGSDYRNYDSLLHLLKNTNGVIISLQRKKSLRKEFSEMVEILRMHDIPILGVLMQK